jgi:isopenicillin-N epimerase
MSNISDSPHLSAIQPDAWSLDPAVTFLNHGSFGACPRVVLERQQELRLEMEREPVDFLVRKMPALVDESRDALARLIGADAADVVFVQNATAGVNSVVRSLEFRPRDEILVTAHDYNACRNVIRYIAQRTGAVVVQADLPLPIGSPQEVIDAVLERVTPRTRLAMLDHITSPTALVFPIEQLVRELDRRGVDTLVDGAHGPGMVPLDMNRLGAAYYTGNCHKWLCAPKAVGFLHVRRDRQQAIQPTIISHGWNKPRPGYSPMQDGFDWPGTLDPSPWMCIGDCIRFLSGLLPGGLEALMRRNHELAMHAQRILCERLGLAPVGVESMLGSMAAVHLPDNAAAFDAEGRPQPAEEYRLNNELFADSKIEVPAFYWPAAPRMLLRVCAHAYNYPAQYERLADVLARKGVCERRK